jgi:hypothetical protein
MSAQVILQQSMVVPGDIGVACPDHEDRSLCLMWPYVVVILGFS